MKRIIQTIFCSLVFLALTSCQFNSYNCSGTEPEHLIDSFYSYQTPEEFVRIVKLTNDSIKVLENSKLDSTDTRPQFDIYKISIPEYKHLEHTGTLDALFYNNRLQAILFYPINPNEYANALNDSLNINLKVVNEINQGCVKILKWTDFKNELYYGWRDKRLDEEQNDWISKYA